MPYLLNESHQLSLKQKGQEKVRKRTKKSNRTGLSWYENQHLIRLENVRNSVLKTERERNYGQSFF